jgi:hypothetical protein
MATDLYYNADPMLEGAVVHGAGRGQLLAQRQRELEELDRFNQDQALKRELQQQSLQYQAQQDSDRMAMQSAQIGAQLYSNEQDWMGRAALEQMNQQGQMNYAAAQGAAQAQAYGAQGAAQYARDLQNARLEKAMSEHDSIQKAWEEGELFTSDEQLQQAQAAWEAKYPELGGWGLPDRIAQEQSAMMEEQQLAALEAAFTFPGSNQPRMGKEQIKAFLALGVDPKEIVGLLPKMETIDVNREKNQQTIEINRNKADEVVANMQRDDERALQENDREQAASEQELQQKAKLQRIEVRTEMQNAKAKALAALQAARIARLNAQTKTDANGDALKLGPDPKLEDYFKEEEWTKLLEELDGGSGEGELKTAPDGTKYIRHADGSVSPAG